MLLKDYLTFADCKGVEEDDVRLWLSEVGAQSDFIRSGIESPLMFVYVRLRPLGRDKEAIDAIEREMLARPKRGLVFKPSSFGWPR